ncbi:hypothetical protein HDU96_000427 [Phlyctochytrium bullatum]|nr:hypothetical protein HDU96_000427 [Phlyctochytrium bullatum]
MTTTAPNDCRTLVEALPWATTSTGWSDAAPADCCDYNTTGTPGDVLGLSAGITCRSRRIVAINRDCFRGFPSRQFPRYTYAIPSSIARLDALEALDIQYCAAGPIPAAVGSLVNLRRLSLGSNSFNGSIPPELGNLRNLKTLLLHDNNLTGIIPGELGNLQELDVLWLSSNLLSGPVPASLGRLTKLQTFLLYNNYLNETVPAVFSKLLKQGAEGEIQIASNCFSSVENATAYIDTTMKNTTACDSFYGRVPVAVSSTTRSPQTATSITANPTSSSTTTVTPVTPPSSLSTGAIAAIVGSVVGLLLVTLIAALWLLHRRRRNLAKQSTARLDGGLPTAAASPPLQPTSGATTTSTGAVLWTAGQIPACEPRPPSTDSQTAGYDANFKENAFQVASARQDVKVLPAVPGGEIGALVAPPRASSMAGPSVLNNLNKAGPSTGVW